MFVLTLRDLITASFVVALVTGIIYLKAVDHFPFRRKKFFDSVYAAGIFVIPISAAAITWFLLVKFFT
jgi:hypothetical protein